MSYELAFVYVLSAFILVCWDFAGVIVGLLALFTFACAVRPADANKASKPSGGLELSHCVLRNTLWLWESGRFKDARSRMPRCRRGRMKLRRAMTLTSCGNGGDVLPGQGVPPGWWQRGSLMKSWPS